MCEPNPSGQSGNGAGGETVDVAVNIFAKPFQTALSLLSLLRHSGLHVGRIWLQYEPFGSQYDYVSPYVAAQYLHGVIGDRLCVFQPEHWLDLNAPDLSRLHERDYRLGIRYQFAFEHSQSRRLFIMHNDVLVLGDVIGLLLENMGEAVAVGHLGQCWNCPAAHTDLARVVMGRTPCNSLSYLDFRPSYDQLQALYAQAQSRGVFARPYDQGFEGIFDQQPWPLPECRVNEWACLINLEQARPLCMPHGPELPPGAFRQCGPICLDTGVEWFRGMHRHGLFARHVDISRHIKHWVGTGKVTARRYALAEENALRILRIQFPEYCAWLRNATGLKSLGSCDAPT